MKLTDFYSGGFLPSSHAYQHGKGINSAVAQAKTYVESGAEFVVEIDIRSFFDNISIGRIIDLLKVDKHDIE